jgi:uncharacterized DUF497 family protein
MEFDWLDVSFDLTNLSPRDVEESFEDPFSFKLLPEAQDGALAARYYNLGRSLNGQSVFSVFWTDGKRYRVVFARPMTRVEADFYERKRAEEN